MNRVLVITAALILCFGVVSAQQSDVAAAKEKVANSNVGFGVNPASSAFSLLDMSRITWSHSYSVSFFSGGRSSGSVGLLNSTMNYELSESLNLMVNLGVLHNTGAVWGDGEHSASFLPGFRLDYRPSENFFMSISYQQHPGYGYYSPYYGRSSLIDRYYGF